MRPIHALSKLSLATLSLMLLPACGSQSKTTEQRGAAVSDTQNPSQIFSSLQEHLHDFVSRLSQGRSLPPDLMTEGSLQSGKLWTAMAADRDLELEDYFDANKDGLQAFTQKPVAFNGTPALILRLLPDVLPKLYQNNGFQKATGYYYLGEKDELPYGFAYTKVPSAPGPLFVNLTCGACHTGRIEDPSTGHLKQLVGAPSTVADINGFRSFLLEAVKDPGFTTAAFANALKAKKDGELYGSAYIAQEKIDKAIFFGTPDLPAQGTALIEGFKTGLVQRYDYASKTVGAYSYKGDLRLLQHSPGHIDFPSAVALATANPSEILADPAKGLATYFPKAPGIGDIMSVWQQDTRVYAQWDGNLKNKLTRNLGAELGIAGDPKAVNLPNAILTTQFVDKLPAPAYPFAIDLVRAERGEKIYEKACASCHEKEQFMPIAAIGTEPGRAQGLTEASRKLLIGALKAACNDPNEANCQIPDEEIVVPRTSNPGYIALPMTGIWARAPYLHNGSVPTLTHLLVPASRPSAFELNKRSYDQKLVGFDWMLSKDENASQNNPSQSASVLKTDSIVYDTRIPGYGNQGHSDKAIFFGGIDFGKDREKLEDLLAYLKTR